MPKFELNKDDTNGHSKLDRENPRRTQPYTKNYQQLREAESTPIGCPVLNGHVRKQNINKIIWTEQVIFGNIYAYAYSYMHTITINKKK